MAIMASFGVPNGFALPYVVAGWVTPVALQGRAIPMPAPRNRRNLRDIETQIDPHYIAKNDTLEFNADYNFTPALTFSSQTGYNNDFLWSTEDYNRFNTATDHFFQPTDANTRVRSLINPLDAIISADNSTISLRGTQDCIHPVALAMIRSAISAIRSSVAATGLCHRIFRDERAWQFSQEFRLASNFNGPFNFSVGGNYMHYETEENYYVFINALTLARLYLDAAVRDPGAIVQTEPWNPGVCRQFELPRRRHDGRKSQRTQPIGAGGRYRLPVHRSQSDLAASTTRATIISSARIPMCSIPMPASARPITTLRRPEADRRYSLDR